MGISPVTIVTLHQSSDRRLTTAALLLVWVCLTALPGWAAPPAEQFRAAERLWDQQQAAERRLKLHQEVAALMEQIPAVKQQPVVAEAQAAVAAAEEALEKALESTQLLPLRERLGAAQAAREQAVLALLTEATAYQAAIQQQQQLRAQLAQRLNQAQPLTTAQWL